MKKLTYISILLFIFFGCKKKNYLQDQKNDVGIGINNAFVLKSEYISHQNNELFINFQVGIVYSGSNIDNVYIPDSAFSNMDFNWHQVVVEKVEKQLLSENLDYSNIMAVDLSGDWHSFDAFNMRTLSLNKFVEETFENPSNELQFSHFRRSESGNNVIDYWLDDSTFYYEQDIEKMKAAIYNSYYYSGGTSNLYDALNNYLEIANFVSNHQNKNITLICTSYPDSENEYTANELIDKAIAYGIKVNLILLNSGSSSELNRIALKTGGFINIVESTSKHDLTLGEIMDKGTPMIGSLYRPLSKNIHVYNVSLKLIRNSGNWTSDMIIQDNYETNIKYSSGEDRLNNIIPIYVEIP